jgi:hypothetical protein
MAGFLSLLTVKVTKTLGASSLLRCLTSYEAVTPRLPLVAVSYYFLITDETISLV